MNQQFDGYYGLFVTMNFKMIEHYTKVKMKKRGDKKHSHTMKIEKVMSQQDKQHPLY